MNQEEMKLSEPEWLIILNKILEKKKRLDSIKLNRVPKEINTTRDIEISNKLLELKSLQQT